MPTAYDRWLRIVTALGAREGPEPTPAGMCSAASDLLAAGGVGLLVMAEGVPGAGFASNRLAEALEDLQFTLGIGPRVDAHARGIPIIESDLAAIPECWVGFGGAAVEAGVGSVFSFPLRLGAARVGALTVYQLGSGPLRGEVYADALVWADVITRALLAGQVGLPAGSLAVGLADEGSFDPRVHQASGMVSAQLEVSVGEALTRLRARAFADGIPLTAVAGEVVVRRLRFDHR